MEEGKDRKTVLVVEGDPQARDRMGNWLEEGGFEVLLCPGPTEERGCVGLRRDGRCSLARAADVVVLNRKTVRETELILHYLTLGKPIVSVGRKGAPVRVLGRDWVLHVPTPDRDGLLEATRSLAGVSPIDWRGLRRSAPRARPEGTARGRRGLLPRRRSDRRSPG